MGNVGYDVERHGPRVPPVGHAAAAVLLAAVHSLGIVPLGVAAALAAFGGSVALLLSARARIGHTLAGIASRARDPFLMLGVTASLAAAHAAIGAVAGGRTDPAPDSLHLTSTALLALAGLTYSVAVLGLLRERLRSHAVELARESLLLAALIAVALWLSWVEAGWLDGTISATQAIADLVAIGTGVTSLILAARLSSAVGPAGRWFVAAPVTLLLAGAAAMASDLTEVVSDTDALAAGGVATVAAAGLVGAAVAHGGLGGLRTAVAVPPARLGVLRLALVLAAVLLVPAVTIGRLIGDIEVSVGSLAGSTSVLSVVAVIYLAGLARDWGQLERRAQHDELTGLPNRRYFTERLALAVADAASQQHTPAVLFCDLDRFKVVNDSLGHATGNQLLVAIAGRLTEALPDDALAARLGGDEFAVLLPDAKRDEALALAQSLRSQLAQPVHVQGRSLHIDASIGIAHFPEDGRAPDALLRAADTAMYGAKDLGRGRVVVHSTTLRTEMESRFALETDLHKAVETGQLHLVYQPRVDLANGAIVGAEALLRWQHPVFGPISPAQFIPVAEETGLIRPVGLYALREACRQLAKWERSGFPRLVVSVNLSARQFELDRVADTVAMVLRETGADPRWLELELTESLAQHDIDEVATTLRDLAEMGVRCSIDDFGTGYSGLSYLGRFPLFALKIDKAFVQTIDAPRPDDARGPGDHSGVVGAVIALGRSFGLRIIAEGVETHQQLGFLIDHGCDELQGHLFSPPVDAESFESLVMLERVANGPGRLEVLKSALATAERNRHRNDANVIHLGGRRLGRTS
jgi:diguanylate cyclase (GGDEF)-like protein